MELLWLILASCGPQPGPSWPLVGSIWSPFGTQSAPVGAPRGPVGTPQGPSDLALGLKEANLAPSAANYAHFALEIVILEHFQISETLDLIEKTCFLNVFSCIYALVF